MEALPQCVGGFNLSCFYAWTLKNGRMARVLVLRSALLLCFYMIFGLEIDGKADFVAIYGNPAILEGLLASLNGRFRRYLW